MSNPSNSYKVSFIHNFDPTGSVLSIKPTVSGSTSASISQTISGPSNSFQSVSSTSPASQAASQVDPIAATTVTLSNILTPSSSSACYTINEPDLTPINEIYSLLDYALPLSVPGEPVSCNSLC